MEISRTIGIHGWDPGITNGDTSSSSGATAWLSHLMSAYHSYGYDVIWVTDLASNKALAVTTHSCEDAVRVCDVIIVMWRWAMPNYPERNALYEEQMRLIDLCLSTGTRVVVHDQDHQISSDDLAYLGHNNIQLYAPELAKRPGVSRLMFPTPYCRHETKYGWERDKKVDLIYVGNNYGRFDQAVGFFSSKSGMDIDASVELYGNWLDPNPERESPDVVKAAMPNVAFGGRLPQTQLVDKLREAYFTLHLFKPSYGPTGFLTMRWAEAVAAGTLAFVPDDFFLPYAWDDLFRAYHLKVKNAAEMSKAMYRFSSLGSQSTNLYQSALQIQTNFVHQYFAIEPWFRLVKGQI